MGQAVPEDSPNENGMFWLAHMKVTNALPKVVTRGEWLVARNALLIREKAATRARDALNAERRLGQPSGIAGRRSRRPAISTLTLALRRTKARRLDWAWHLENGAARCQPSLTSYLSYSPLPDLIGAQWTSPGLLPNNTQAPLRNDICGSSLAQVPDQTNLGSGSFHTPQRLGNWTIAKILCPTFLGPGTLGTAGNLAAPQPVLY